MNATTQERTPRGGSGTKPKIKKNIIACCASVKGPDADYHRN
jgi:hypothetical protein